MCIYKLTFASILVSLTLPVVVSQNWASAAFKIRVWINRYGWCTSSCLQSSPFDDVRKCEHLCRFSHIFKSDNVGQSCATLKSKHYAKLGSLWYQKLYPSKNYAILIPAHTMTTQINVLDTQVWINSCFLANSCTLWIAQKLRQFICSVHLPLRSDYLFWAWL